MPQPARRRRMSLGHRVQQPGGGPHCHQQRVLVVVALMRLPTTEPHGHAHVPSGWLVHVVPDACQPGSTCAALSSPHQLRPSSVTKSGRQCCQARLGRCRDRLLRCGRHITLDSLIEDPVAGIELDARVDDRDPRESLRVEALQHAGRVGEAVCVPGEDAVAVHVFDVEPHGITRDVVVAVPLRGLHSILGVGEPAALVIADQIGGGAVRPQPGVGLQDRRHVWACETYSVYWPPKKTIRYS